MKKIATFFFLLIIITQTCFAAIIPTEKPKEKEEAEIVNDYAKLFTQEQADSLRKELRFLFTHQKGDTAAQLRMFLFTTDAQHGGLSSAESKLLSTVKLDPEIAPVVFIYDVTAQRYILLADEKLETFISPSYATQLVESKFDNGLNYDKISEIMIRFSTITELAMANGLVRQNLIPAKEEVESKHGKFEISTFTKQREKPEPKKEEPKQEETESGLPIPIILLAVALTALGMRKWFVQYLERRKKRQRA